MRDWPRLAAVLQSFGKGSVAAQEIAQTQARHGVGLGEGPEDNKLWIF